MIVELKDQVLSVIKGYLRDKVYGPIPALVVGVDEYEGRQTVNVEIAVNRKYVSGKLVLEKGSTIYGVPFVNPGAGGGVTTYPVKVGDTVLLVFGMRDITSWKVSDGSDQVTPDEPRYMSSTDAIAIPGLCTINNHQSPNPDNLEIKFKDGLISMRPDNEMVITNGAFTFTASPEGTATLTNGSVTYTMNADGSTTETNGNGTKTLATSGQWNINGFIINTDGSVDSPVSVTAPTVTGSTSLVAGSDEVVGHDHGGVDSGTSRTNPIGS